jgi:hypothetical protein
MLPDGFAIEGIFSAYQTLSRKRVIPWLRSTYMLKSAVHYREAVRNERIDSGVPD